MKIFKGLLLAFVVAFLAGTFFAEAAQTEPDPARCDAGEEIFFDDFSDPASGWPTDSTSDGFEWSYAPEEEFRAFITSDAAIAWEEAPFAASMMPENFCLEVDVKVLFQGILTDDVTLGLLFAGNPVFGEDANFAVFEVFPAGQQYYISNVQNTPDFVEFDDLVGYEDSDVINGVNEVNNLLIMAENGEVHFFVNDTYLVTFELLTSGGIGLVAESYEEPNVNARFDNFRIVELTN